MSKTVASDPTVSCINDVTAPLSQILTDGTRKYVHGLGLEYALDSSGTVAVYQTDGLESTRVIADGSGNVVQAYQTDASGNPTQTLGAIDQPFRFTGQLRDTETGFSDLRACLYDPATGRFVSRDPPAGVLGNPSSLNRYAYAGNNPVTGTDPSGMEGSGQCGMQEGEPVGPATCALSAGVGGGAVGEPGSIEPILDVTGAIRGLEEGASALAERALAPGESLPRERPAAGTGEGEILERLPAYTGGKTSGILVVGQEEIPLTSGYEGPAAELPSGTPGFHNLVRSHVEAHAAALMRRLGLRVATLYINRIPCSNARPGGCEQMLPRMLPEGASLHVYGPSNFRRVYTGLPD